MDAWLPEYGPRRQRHEHCLARSKQARQLIEGGIAQQKFPASNADS